MLVHFLFLHNMKLFLLFIVIIIIFIIIIIILQDLHFNVRYMAFKMCPAKYKNFNSKGQIENYKV